jgi:uncharacterized membrane protein
MSVEKMKICLMAILLLSFVLAQNAYFQAGSHPDTCQHTDGIGALVESS